MLIISIFEPLIATASTITDDEQNEENNVICTTVSYIAFAALFSLCTSIALYVKTKKVLGNTVDKLKDKNQLIQNELNNVTALFAEALEKVEQVEFENRQLRTNSELAKELVIKSTVLYANIPEVV